MNKLQPVRKASGDVRTRALSCIQRGKGLCHSISFQLPEAMTCPFTCRTCCNRSLVPYIMAWSRHYGRESHLQSPTPNDFSYNPLIDDDERVHLFLPCEFLQCNVYCLRSDRLKYSGLDPLFRSPLWSHGRSTPVYNPPPHR